MTDVKSQYSSRHCKRQSLPLRHRSDSDTHKSPALFVVFAVFRIGVDVATRFPHSDVRAAFVLIQLPLLRLPNKVGLFFLAQFD